MEPRTNRRINVALAFAKAANRYWLDVFPTARREIHRLQGTANDIPDPVLRRLALATQQQKWGNLEGAAAFAAFTSRRHRAVMTRLLVALQSIYDYADTLTEEPHPLPSVNAAQLHTAILAALHPGQPHVDYYAHHARGDDRGYLVGLIDACRGGVSLLPAYPLVSEAVSRNARRIVAYQRHINSEAKQGYPAFAEWARRETPAGSDLRWWETGAACGSSMAIFALLAAAADPQLTPSEAERVEEIYWPWAGAWHTLLDSTVDRAEDIVIGQHSLVGHYASPQEMAQRIHLIAAETMRRASAVGAQHRLILAGMASLYLTEEQAWVSGARPTAEAVLATLEELAAPAMLVLRMRRLSRAD